MRLKTPFDDALDVVVTVLTVLGAIALVVLLVHESTMFAG